MMGDGQGDYWDKYAKLIEQFANSLIDEIWVEYPGFVVYERSKIKDTIGEIQKTFLSDLAEMKKAMGDKEDLLARHKIAAIYVKAILQNPIFEPAKQVPKGIAEGAKVPTVLWCPNEFLALDVARYILVAFSKRVKEALWGKTDCGFEFPKKVHYVSILENGECKHTEDNYILSMCKLLYYYRTIVPVEKFPLFMFSELLVALEIASDCANYGLKDVYFSVSKHVFTFEDFILRGFECAKDELSRIDSANVLVFPDIKNSLELIANVARYYEREYLESGSYKKDSVQSVTYSLVKSIMHLRLIECDVKALKQSYSDSDVKSRQLTHCNEIFCWHILYHMYEVFIQILQEKERKHAEKGERRERHRYCVDHFLSIGKAFVSVLHFSKNRLSDITRGYIHLVFELLMERHENILADRIRILLGHDGFIDFLVHWAKEGRKIALFFCDLDKFKQVNDDNNHEEGDRVLNAFAGILA